ncbi:MAG: PKD domain protein [Bacteroidetes bacterium ADurb.Bin408]|nr:MAG: PKD domain protein [Bacteroidetes bacterium ADurb.Bin408]
MLYLWDFGDGTQDTLPTPSHTFTTAGTYTVSLIATDSNKCNIADTAYLTISVLDVPVINLGADQKICKGQNVTLDAGNAGMSHLWSTGATTQSITVTDSSLYWVNVTNGPCTSSDTVSITLTEEITYTIPNVFTPNGDNINELFKLESPSEITEFSGLIFNRWGKKVFEWDNPVSGWNGMIENASAADGVYYYIITFKNQCGENEVHGTVTLMR